MSRLPNQFIDPADGTVFNWLVNHDSEDNRGRKRQVTATALTNGNGVVRQMGGLQPLTMTLKGTILHEQQRLAFIEFYQRCQNEQTIQFREFNGELFEVIITDYEEQKQAGGNRNDPQIPFHYYTYTLTMDVVKVLAGSWGAMFE